VLDRIIAERAATPPADPPRDLFDVLVTARDPETDQPFAPDALRDQIATLIIAGHETTALTLFWSLYLLALAPEWQERVAEEAACVDLSPEDAPAAYARCPWPAPWSRRRCASTRPPTPSSASPTARTR
jgi:unspecific monooxygenase